MSAKLKKIKDQVVVVTGASLGIGLATAELLAEKGASVGAIGVIGGKPDQDHAVAEAGAGAFPPSS